MEPRLKEVVCSGTPTQMGEQYGEQARDQIRANQERFYERPAIEASQAVALLTQALRRTLPDVVAELEGISRGSGASLGGLVLANHFLDSEPRATSNQGCTSLAVRQTPVGPILGKNNDGLPQEHQFVIRRSTPTHGLPMIQVTLAGWLSGLDAINGAGLTNSHNSVGSRLQRPAAALDVRLWAYHLMRTAKTAAAFVHALTAASLTGKGYNILVADAAGDVRVLEAALPAVMQRSNREPFIYSTNHYVCDALCDADMRQPRAKKVSIHRFEHLASLEQASPPASLSDVRQILCSHLPWGPCRHGGAHIDHTLWSMIALPKTQHLFVSHGPPCMADYEEFCVN